MSASYMAGGNISPSRMVYMDTTQGVGGVVIQCTATSQKPIGISGQATRQPPLVGLDDGYTGIQNVNQIIVYEVNDVCYAETGANIAQGDLLMTDGSGRVVTSVGDGTFYIARAEESNTNGAGSLIKVTVLSPAMRGA